MSTPDLSQHQHDEEGGDTHDHAPIPPMQNHTLDLRTLTSSEEQILRKVIERDAQEMESLDNRISLIRKDIQDIRVRGALVEGDHQNTMCARCKHKFWLIPLPLTDRGVRCIRCKFRICAKCRFRQINNTWLCILCLRYREEKILSGEWMFNGPIIGLFGSDLMRASLRDKGRVAEDHYTDIPGANGGMQYSQKPAFSKDNDGDSGSRTSVNSTTPSTSGGANAAQSDGLDAVGDTGSMRTGAVSNNDVNVEEDSGVATRVTDGGGTPHYNTDTERPNTLVSGSNNNNFVRSQTEKQMKKKKGMHKKKDKGGSKFADVIKSQKFKKRAGTLRGSSFPAGGPGEAREATSVTQITDVPKTSKSTMSIKNGKQGDAVPEDLLTTLNEEPSDAEDGEEKGKKDGKEKHKSKSADKHKSGTKDKGKGDKKEKDHHDKKSDKKDEKSKKDRKSEGKSKDKDKGKGKDKDKGKGKDKDKKKDKGKNKDKDGGKQRGKSKDKSHGKDKKGKKDEGSKKKDKGSKRKGGKNNNMGPLSSFDSDDSEMVDMTHNKAESDGAEYGGCTDERHGGERKMPWNTLPPNSKTCNIKSLSIDKLHPAVLKPMITKQRADAGVSVSNRFDRKVLHQPSLSSQSMPSGIIGLTHDSPHAQVKSQSNSKSTPPTHTNIRIRPMMNATIRDTQSTAFMPVAHNTTGPRDITRRYFASKTTTKIVNAPSMFAPTDLKGTEAASTRTRTQNTAAIDETESNLKAIRVTRSKSTVNRTRSTLSNLAESEFGSKFPGSKPKPLKMVTSEIDQTQQKSVGFEVKQHTTDFPQACVEKSCDLDAVSTHVRMHTTGIDFTPEAHTNNEKQDFLSFELAEHLGNFDTVNKEQNGKKRTENVDNTKIIGKTKTKRPLWAINETRCSEFGRVIVQSLNTIPEVVVSEKKNKPTGTAKKVFCFFKNRLSPTKYNASQSPQVEPTIIKNESQNVRSYRNNDTRQSDKDAHFKAESNAQKSSKVNAGDRAILPTKQSLSRNKEHTACMKQSNKFRKQNVSVKPSLCPTSGHYNRGLEGATSRAGKDVYMSGDDGSSKDKKHRFGENMVPKKRNAKCALSIERSFLFSSACHESQRLSKNKKHSQGQKLFYHEESFGTANDGKQVVNTILSRDIFHRPNPLPEKCVHYAQKAFFPKKQIIGNASGSRDRPDGDCWSGDVNPSLKSRRPLDKAIPWSRRRPIYHLGHPRRGTKCSADVDKSSTCARQIDFNVNFQPRSGVGLGRRKGETKSTDQKPETGTAGNDHDQETTKKGKKKMEKGEKAEESKKDTATTSADHEQEPPKKGKKRSEKADKADKTEKAEEPKKGRPKRRSPEANEDSALINSTSGTPLRDNNGDVRASSPGAQRRDSYSKALENQKIRVILPKGNGDDVDGRTDRPHADATHPESTIPMHGGNDDLDESDKESIHSSLSSPSSNRPISKNASTNSSFSSKSSSQSMPTIDNRRARQHSDSSSVHQKSEDEDAYVRGGGNSRYGDRSSMHSGGGGDGLHDYDHTKPGSVGRDSSSERKNSFEEIYDSNVNRLVKMMTAGQVSDSSTDARRSSPRLLPRPPDSDDAGKDTAAAEPTAGSKDVEEAGAGAKSKNGERDPKGSGKVTLLSMALEQRYMDKQEHPPLRQLKIYKMLSSSISDSSLDLEEKEDVRIRKKRLPVTQSDRDLRKRTSSTTFPRTVSARQPYDPVVQIQPFGKRHDSVRDSDSGVNSSQTSRANTPDQRSLSSGGDKGFKLNANTNASPSDNKSPPEFPLAQVPTIAVTEEAREEDDDLDELFSQHRHPYGGSNLSARSSLRDSRESLYSVYSAAGEDHYGDIPVTGEVQFHLEYNYKTGALSIHVKQCKELAPVDTKKNRSDPYVKTYLLPDKTRNGKRKTKIKRHTLNPTYNETLTYTIAKTELESRTLWLSVWNNDRFGRNDFLGEVTIPLDYYEFDKSAPTWYTLQDRGKKDDNEETGKLPSDDSPAMTYKGDLFISLKYVPASMVSGTSTMKKKGSLKRKDKTALKTGLGEIHVLVKEAHNLTAMRSGGGSNPFCKGYLLPDETHHSKQKTPVVKKTTSPNWQHLLVFEGVDETELENHGVELTVWDHETLSSNDFLGGVRLNTGTGYIRGKATDWMDARGEEIEVWQRMTDRHNEWIDIQLPLRASMGKPKK